MHRLIAHRPPSLPKKGSLIGKASASRRPAAPSDTLGALEPPWRDVMADVIPVIDLGPHLAGRPGALRAAAAELRNALEGVGFFIVVGHGVPRELIERTFAEARRFHAQPYEAKMALRMYEHNHGYNAHGPHAPWASHLQAQR